jgi:hypothetical protein
MLTDAQYLVLKANILADPVLNAIPNTADGAFEIAAAYNAQALPDFWVWRTAVPQFEIVSTTTADGTNWSWTSYIGRSQGERDGWREMFADTGSINFARPNVRQGLQDIFSGAGGAAQRTHLLAIGRRKATRAEKLFATGTGSTASPATSAFDDGFQLSYQDVLVARSLP